MTEPATTPTERSPAEASPVLRFIRRTAGAAIIGIVFFAVLWITTFNAMNAALVGSGTAVILVAGSSASETFQFLFEMISEFILGIFGSIVNFFASIFD
jgi:hypothetical protein